MGNSTGRHSRRPHSALGVRNGEHRYFGFDDFETMNRCDDLKRLNPRAKAILPPLPRSHSFHQILRSTENGMNLIQKGTIRGGDGKQPSKSLVPGEVGIEEIMNPELNAILKSRRCKSETNLNSDESDDRLGQTDDVCNKSVDSRSDAVRKGHPSGVAARIQRAKYKAPPAPPAPTNHQSNSFGLFGNSFGINQKIDIKTQDEIRGSNRSLKQQEMRIPDAKPKVGLIRRLSENSYISSRNKEKKDVDVRNNDEFVSIPRLSVCSFDSNKERNVVFDSRSHYIGNENRFKGSAFIEKKESFKKCSDKWNKATKMQFSNNHLDRRTSELEAKEDAFVAYEENKLFAKSFERMPKQHFTPNFDDNFILRRATPTAGLTSSAAIALSSSPQRTNGSYSNYCHRQKFDRYELDRSERGYDDIPAFDPYSGITLANHIQNNAPRLISNSSRGSQWRSDFYSIEESNTSHSNGPLKEVNKKSYISDSANFSDEEEEEEIRVVLKPYLPPPRKITFNAERFVITEDIFNVQKERKKCWTPLEDLTSSDDDDGINCDHTSDEEEVLRRNRGVCEVIRDSSTRFTLQNQLRTLIQNNKLRHVYP